MSSTTRQRPPPYELFFAPLYISLTPSECEMVQFAYFCSKYGHAGQKRDDGSRYFDHPKSAAWIYIHELGGRDPRLIVLLMLHDMSEDAYLLSPYRIMRNFGHDTAQDMCAVTKLKGKETTKEYLERVILQGPWAMVAKLCDRLDNLRTLGGCTPEKQEKQIAETLAYHLPMLISALRALGEVWATYADQLQEKIRAAIHALQPTP